MLNKQDPSRGSVKRSILVQHGEQDAPYRATLLHPRGIDPEALLAFDRDVEHEGHRGEPDQHIFLTMRHGDTPHRITLAKPQEGRHEIIGGAGGQLTGLHVEGLLTPDQRHHEAVRRVQRERESDRARTRQETIAAAKLDRKIETPEPSAPQHHTVPVSVEQAIQISRVNALADQAKRSHAAGHVDHGALRQLAGTGEDQPFDPKTLGSHIEALRSRGIESATDQAGAKLDWVQRFVRHGEPTILFTRTPETADALYRHLSPHCRVAVDHDHVDPVERIAARIGFDPPGGRDPDSDVLIASRPELASEVTRPHHAVYYDQPVPAVKEPNPAHLSQHVLVADTLHDRSKHTIP